jgi:CubicO group peptidase (beta-lactamase class C family)
VAGPGAAHAYSDIGFIALTDVLERAGGDRLDALFGRLVAAPLASRLCFDGVGAAATEDCTLRGRVIEGEVHDPHAWWMQGVSAHAGLFGSARAVASIAEGLRQAVADPSRWPPGAVLGRLWKARGPGSHVGGWDTPTRGGYTSTGGRFPDDAVGHLGYTGTSLWVVPSWRASVALLTNRIHPRDDKAAIRDARPEIHDAVASALEV